MMTITELPPLAGWPRARAATDGAAPAIVDGELTVSYTELHERADALATALDERGYRPGDRIATLTRSSAEHLVLLFACALRDVSLVPLSWRLSDEELRAQLAIADPAALLATDDFLHRARLLAPVTGTLSDPPSAASDPDSDSGLLIVFTSGTEAHPKAAVLSAEACRASAVSLQGAVHLTAQDVVLGVLPQYHAAGWNTQPLLALAVGATLRLQPRFDAGEVLETIERHAVTAMMGVPSMWVQLARHPRFTETDLSTLRTAIVGGAQSPGWLWAAWRDRGVTLRQGYGLTEAGPNVLCQTTDDARSTPGAAGRPYPLVSTALEKRGELLVRGPSVFSGYFRDPAATAAAFTDGWLRTGDLAAIDPDGQYRIVDRAKDIFISGGENVAPAEIEAVLLGHPSVVEAAVVAEPDEVWGERGVAYVVAPDASVEELREFCAARLAAFKVPARIELVAALPHSGIDKVVRRRLAGTS